MNFHVGKRFKAEVDSFIYEFEITEEPQPRFFILHWRVTKTNQPRYENHSGFSTYSEDDMLRWIRDKKWIITPMHEPIVLPEELFTL